MEEIPRRRIPKKRKPALVKIVYKNKVKSNGYKPKRDKQDKHNSKDLYRRNKIIKLRIPSDDYLKLFRIVRFWACDTYKMTLLEFEFCLFLYSEGLFKRERFRLFERSLSFSKSRLEEFLEKGIILKYGSGGGKTGRAILFKLSPKYSNMCTDVYNLLNGDKELPIEYVQPKKHNTDISRSGYITARNFHKELSKHTPKTKKSLFDPKNDFLEE